MSKVLKRFLLISFVLCFAIATPIYAVLRIVVPEEILSRVSQSLPSNISFSVATVKSKANLEVVYTDIVFRSKSSSVIIPRLTLKPIMSFKKPISASADIFYFKSGPTNIKASNVDANIIFSGLDLSNFSIEGNFDKINSLEDALIVHGDFLIAGINSPKKTMKINVEKVEISSKTPTGNLHFTLLESSQHLSLDTNLSGDIVSEKAYLTYIPFMNQDSHKKLEGDQVEINFSLQNRTSELGWILPLQLKAQMLKANGTSIFESFDLKAQGEWPVELSKSCKFSQIFSGEAACGKMRHVVDVSVKAENTSNSIHLTGNGFCVTPNAGCKQIIQAKLNSWGTQNIFSQLIQTETFNPVILSVLMGMLLGSPSETSDYLHSIDLRIDGSQILVNDKPLF